MCLDYGNSDCGSSLFTRFSDLRTKTQSLSDGLSYDHKHPVVCYRVGLPLTLTRIFHWKPSASEMRKKRKKHEARCSGASMEHQHSVRQRREDCSFEPCLDTLATPLNSEINKQILILAEHGGADL